MDELKPGTATAIAAAIRNREISAVELLQQHFDRVDRLNPTLNALVWEDRQSAMDQARKLDQETVAGVSRGPLHGVPVTVKEAFDLVGSPSTWGIPAWRDNYPETDSEVVTRYRSAGAIIFGKTNVPLKLYEWQSFNEIYGTTCNPWDLTRTPGGSSGGSAVALASGMSALEAGSDIGSSIRNPAHYCGVFGLKPTWGIVPLQGHLPPNWYGNIDIGVTGPMARSATDLELAFNILQGADRFHSAAWQSRGNADTRTELSQFRVAVKTGDSQCPVDQGYLDALDRFTAKIENAGAVVSTTDAPLLHSEEHFNLYLTLLGAAMSANISLEQIDRTRASVQALGKPAVERLMTPRLNGTAMRHSDWLTHDNKRLHARLQFDRFFRQWDILITPVCASTAFPHDHNGARHERDLIINGSAQPEIMQLFWSGYSGVAGLPSVVGPAGFVDGLPAGYQAIAGYGADRTALAFAKAVEREIGGFTAPDCL